MSYTNTFTGYQRPFASTYAVTSQGTPPSTSGTPPRASAIVNQLTPPNAINTGMVVYTTDTTPIRSSTSSIVPINYSPIVSDVNTVAARAMVPHATSRFVSLPTTTYFDTNAPYNPPATELTKSNARLGLHVWCQIPQSNTIKVGFISSVVQDKVFIRWKEPASGRYEDAKAWNEPLKLPSNSHMLNSLGMVYIVEAQNTLISASSFVNIDKK